MRASGAPPESTNRCTAASAASRRPARQCASTTAPCAATGGGRPAHALAAMIVAEPVHEHAVDVALSMIVFTSTRMMHRCVVPVQQQRCCTAGAGESKQCARPPWMANCL